MNKEHLLKFMTAKERSNIQWGLIGDVVTLTPGFNISNYRQITHLYSELAEMGYSFSSYLVDTRVHDKKLVAVITKAPLSGHGHVSLCIYPGTPVSLYSDLLSVSSTTKYYYDGGVLTINKNRDQEGEGNYTPSSLSYNRNVDGHNKTLVRHYDKTGLIHESEFDTASSFSN